MVEEMKNECVELSITACEKFAANYEVMDQCSAQQCRFYFRKQTIFEYFKMAAKSIKETMDTKFGTYWHVVVGEGFGFEVSHETKNILYLFFGGNLAVIVWKCS